MFNIVEHGKIYTKDSTGKTRLWWMDQLDNKYRTNSGVLDGNIVTSEWTEAKPKNVGKVNETSGEEQASLEIEAKYKKQLKTGYHEDIRRIDEIQYVEPMLAKKYSEYKTKHGLFTRKGEKYLSVPHIEKALEKFFAAFPDAVLDGELYNYDKRQKLNELMSLVRKTKNISKEDLKKSEEIVEYVLYDGYNIGGQDHTTIQYQISLSSTNSEISICTRKLY